MPVLVEVQFRTIAMDFWASLEHKIYYKYRRAGARANCSTGCSDAAETAAALDGTMERLHREVRGLDDLPAEVVAGLRHDHATPDAALLSALRRLGRVSP